MSSASWGCLGEKRGVWEHFNSTVSLDSSFFSIGPQTKTYPPYKGKSCLTIQYIADRFIEEYVSISLASLIKFVLAFTLSLT